MLIEKVRKTVKEHTLIGRGNEIVLGLSGGPDSVCLFHVLMQIADEMDLSIHPVHVNHMFRPGAADRDQEYVERLCAENGLECRSFTVDCTALAEEKDLTPEEAGRMARYEAFYKVASELKVKDQRDESSKEIPRVLIAVAQNANDQAETVLQRIIRGTGPDGLAGIAYKFGKKKAKPAPTAANYLMETAENQSANTSAATPVVTEQTEKPQPQPTALGAVEIKKPETTTQNIHFTIGRSAVTARNKKMLAQTAEWVKAHEGATVSLTGYADKGTGNATINQKISRQRVEAVKAELIRQGVNASRITTDAKGDTVQPFAQNDQNRVVIAICEEK